MISVKSDSEPTYVESKDFKPNSLYRDFEGDLWLTNDNGRPIGYFTSRNIVSGGTIRFTLNDSDCLGSKFTLFTGALYFA